MPTVAYEPTEEERRTELARTAEKVAELLIQYDRRISLLESFNETVASAIRWVGTSVVVLLAAILAAGVLR